ncbi:MAG: replication initiator protein A [Acetobacter aceti]
MPSEQEDLFLDTPSNPSMRGDRALMEFPFFSLSKTPRREPIMYDDGRVSIKVSPGERGIATIWDKDVLIYVTSLLNAQIERGLTPSRTVAFAASDFLRVADRGTSGRAYSQFKDALFRLRSTTITTTISAAGEQEDRGFGWIDSWRLIRRTGQKGGKITEAVEVTLNDWMYRAILRERRVLSMDQEYFSLSMALERRIYELVRKHLGQQDSWAIMLPRLAEKIGTERDLRKLRAELNQIIKKDSLIRYRMQLELPAGMKRVTANRIKVVFSHRLAICG